MGRLQGRFRWKFSIPRLVGVNRAISLYRQWRVPLRQELGRRRGFKPEDKCFLICGIVGAVAIWCVRVDRQEVSVNERLYVKQRHHDRRQRYCLLTKRLLIDLNILTVMISRNQEWYTFEIRRRKVRPIANGLRVISATSTRSFVLTECNEPVDSALSSCNTRVGGLNPVHLNCMRYWNFSVENFS